MEAEEPRSRFFVTAGFYRVEWGGTGSGKCGSRVLSRLFQLRFLLLDGLRGGFFFYFPESASSVRKLSFFVTARRVGLG